MVPPKEFFRKRFDTSIIGPSASDELVKHFIRSCKRYRDYLAAVAFNLHQIPLAVRDLQDSDIDVCAVVAYPLGCVPTEFKAAQAEYAAENGAQQIDLCVDVGVFRSGKYEDVRRDIENVVKAVKGKIANISVIAYTAYLRDDEKVMACKIIKEGGGTTFKTNTGFGFVTTVEEIRLIKREVGNSLEVMASGGVRDVERAIAMFEAGADKIATGTPFEIFEGIERLRQPGRG